MSIDFDTAELLSKYFDAATNLYEVVSLRVLFRIYNEQNDPISEKVFCEFADTVQNRKQIYYEILSQKELYEDDDLPDCHPLDRELIHESLIMCDLEDYEEIK